MHVNGNKQSSSPNHFTLEEFHRLATDPDFKIRLEHARKLSVQSLDDVRALLTKLPTPKTLKALFANTREQLLWLMGDKHKGYGRLAYACSDDKVALFIDQKALREPMQELISGLMDLCDSDEKVALSVKLKEIVESSSPDTAKAKRLFALIYEVVVPKWEEKATREVHQRSSFYAKEAFEKEVRYFCEYTCDQFLKGQTGRFVQRVVEEPHKHGLTNSALSGTLAVHHLQTALLCDVISQDSEVIVQLLPETLVFDVEHLLRLRTHFKNVIQAQCIADFYAPVLGVNCNKKEIFKTVLFALNEGDESLGLNLSPEALEKLKRIATKGHSAAADLHRSRMRRLIYDAADRGFIDKEQAKAWHCEALVDELSVFNEHLSRILQVHFPVFVNIYYAILENRIESEIFSSLFSNDGNRIWKNWMATEDHDEAEQIRGEFRRVVERLSSFVPLNQRVAIWTRLQQCLLTNERWNELDAVVNVHGNGDVSEIIKDVHALFARLQAFRTLLQKKRQQKCVDDRSRRIPQHLRSGWRVL